MAGSRSPVPPPTPRSRSVRGPLLPDEDAEWADVARQRCETRVAAARRIKIEATFATADWAAVVAQAEAVLVEHPYDEDVLRMLMRAYASSGSTAAALAAYARARARFVDDLGVSPSAETERLHTQLLLDNESPVALPVPPRARPAGPRCRAGAASTSSSTM